MTPLLLAPVPVFVVLLLIIVAMIPWGGPDWVETALALIPVSAIYFWSLRRPRLMPALVVFALGLVLDVMTQGPLGVWTAAALVAGLAGRLARRSQQRIGWLRGAALVIITLAAATGLVTVMTSLYGWQLVAVRTVLEAFVGACLAYPLLAGLLSALDGLWPAAASRPLFLRGD